MAELVLAIGTSHGPALNSPPEDFPPRAGRDKVNPNLLDKDGRPSSYEELVVAANPAVSDQIEPAAMAASATRSTPTFPLRTAPRRRIFPA